MAELASLAPNLGFAVPQVTGTFDPKYSVPTYQPDAFLGALRFAAKPLDPNTFTGAVDNLGNTLSTIASPQYQFANATSRAGLDAFNLAGKKIAAANDPNNQLPSDLTAIPVGNASVAPAVATSTGAISPAAAPTGSVAGVSNVSAPDANGTFHTTGTVFAGTNDLNAYHAAKAAGATELQALAVGDNGIGASGAHTADSTKNYVAASPAFMAANGLKFGDSLAVTANGQTVNATIEDHLPNNSKNGSGLDLNPGTANSLGVDPDHFKGPISFKINGASSTSLSDGNALVSNDGGALDRAIASVQGQSAVPPAPAPLFGFSPNVAPNDVPPSQGAVAANAIAQKPMVPVGSDVPNPPAVPAIAPVPAVQSAPVLAPTYQAPPQSAFQQRLTAAFGAGHPIVSPDGRVGFETNAPLNPLQQGELNLMPLKAQLEQQQVAQDQQRLNQAAQLAPLTIQAEQAKINLAQRQADAAAQMSKASAPIVIPPTGLPDNPAPTSTSSVDPSAPFSPGHILLPLITTTVKDGVPVQNENPGLNSALAGARQAGVGADEHTKVINGQPYVDITSLAHASGAGTVALREQSNQFGNKYLLAQSAADAVNAYVDPKTPKNGSGDRQLVDEVLQTAAPGTKPGEADVKALLESHGLGDMYESLKNRVFTPYDPPFLSDTKRQNLAAAANTSTQARAKEYLTFANANTAGVAQKALQASTSATAQSSMVQMRSPSGKIGSIPSANVAAATAKGFSIIQ